MHKSRYLHIDFIRAFAITVIIITHVFSYYQTNPLNNFIWNYSHFVVPAFVFCSGYVLAVFYKNQISNIFETLTWYKKRLLRLLIPFYIYLFIHYLLLITFPNFFSGLGLNKSPDFIFQSITLINGISLSWLPLLFMELTILFPLLIYIASNRKRVFIYVIFALIVTLLFTIFTFPYTYYRMVMWIPWSLIILLAIYFAKAEKEKTKISKYLFISLISGLTFIILFIVWNFNYNSLNLIDYKYPPGFYYFSYATSLTFASLILSRAKIWQSKLVSKFYIFVSQNSYSLFFIHYIVLDFTLQIKKVFLFSYGVKINLILVVLLSLLITYCLKFVRGFIVYSVSRLYKPINSLLSRICPSIAFSNSSLVAPSGKLSKESKA